MSTLVCRFHLIGQCRRRQCCPNAHPPLLAELAPMTRTKHITIMSQRAWPNKRAESECTSALIESLFQCARDDDRITVLEYDTSPVYVMYGASAKECSASDGERSAQERVCEAVTTPHTRNRPDCFIHCLMTMLATVCARAQADPVLQCQQVVVFTYTGAVGDYSDVRQWTHVVNTLRTLKIRVIVISFGQPAFDSLRRLVAYQDTFACFDGVRLLSTFKRRVARVRRLSEFLHAKAVLDAHQQRGVGYDWLVPGADRVGMQQLQRAGVVW